MKNLNVEQLSLEAYKPFGTYVNLINPQDEKIGTPPIEFFRDQLQLDVTPFNMLSYSCLRVEKQPLVINVLEYHSSCCELLLPLDNDMILQVAPAVGEGDSIPFDKLRVFLIPKGTAITLRPGVWHYAPFTANDDPVNILVNLPERTYANDCIVVNFNKEDYIQIAN